MKFTPSGGVALTRVESALGASRETQLDPALHLSAAASLAPPPPLLSEPARDP
jgi:hypothetical protein